MRILDSTPQVLAQLCGGPLEWERWRQYARAVAPTLAEKAEADAEEYDRDAQVRLVVERALADPARLQALSAAFQRVMAKLPERAAQVFGADLDVDVVLYLGLCNGAGWATELNGRSAVLLGMEKILELNWDGERELFALIAHELGHIWHASVRRAVAPTDCPGEQSAWQLYSEGMAMHCEQRLSGRARFYHQDGDGWLAWCDAHLPEALDEYRRQVRAGEPTAEFFGDWNRWRGRSDVGYYLGGEFIAALARGRALEELANLTMAEVIGALERWDGDPMCFARRS